MVAWVSRCSLDSTPSLRNYICPGCSPKKTKKKKKKKERKKERKKRKDYVFGEKAVLPILPF